MSEIVQVESAERIATRKLLTDLRAANEQLVIETLRAQDAADDASSAQREEVLRLQQIVSAQREANDGLVRAAQSAADARALAEAARAYAEHAREVLETKGRELVSDAESREQLLGMIAHDLRNPLNGLIMSATMLLRKGALASPDDLLVARILATGKRMARMVSRLFEFTRARLGERWPLASSTTDLRELVGQVVAELTPITGTPIELDVRGDLTVLCDGDRMTDAISNLLGNAVDFATPGTPVCIYANALDDKIVVEVSNRGAPIPESVLPFLFQPFRRAPGHASAPGDHLGLGLYIAHEVAVAHGGSLAAWSANGTTTFTLLFPRVAS